MPTQYRPSPTPRAMVCATIVLAVVAMLGVRGAHAQVGSMCGPIENAYGPYDYRVDKDKLGVVEQFHYGPIVAAGIRGMTSTEPGPDLDYTLRAFPNHHRALLSLMRWGEKKKSQKPFALNWTVECYFERALRFRPQDIVARMLYVQYLMANARQPEAGKQLEFSEQFADSAFAYNYLGLMYTDLKRYDRALAQAHKAAQMGYDVSELRDILQKAGQWQEPPPQAAASSPAASETTEPAKP